MTKSDIAIVASMMVAGVCAIRLQAAPEGKAPVNFSVETRGEYTDNRDAVATGEESNFDFYLSPRIDVYLDFERTFVNLYYVPTFRYRTDPAPTQNDSEFFHDFGLNLDSQVSPNTALRLHEKFDYNDDPSVEDGGFTVREDRTYIMNRVTAVTTRTGDRLCGMRGIQIG